ncbi:hypothetical protein TNCV_2889051 [Trichonephila clavipes]|nr:hypothetical protein TNCV_2889051 [Trichonephila clavipes]
MIEELHRPLKSAIKCHATERWTEVLPIILLGLRASLKEDILCTPAELVFGTTIRLPGEMFDSSKPDDDVVNFVSKLKSHMQSLHPKPPKHHGKRPVFIHPGLLEATHVFLRGDICKPAFFLNTEDLQLPQTKNETPATVVPNATASTPATVESDPTASTPTQPSTRSGRKVHLPTSFINRLSKVSFSIAEELLREFFFFYAEFDYTNVICPLTSQLKKANEMFSKSDSEDDKFLVSSISIEDPLDLNWNVTCGVSWKYSRHFKKNLHLIHNVYQNEQLWKPCVNNWGLMLLLEDYHELKSYKNACPDVPSGDKSEARPLVFKSPSKLGTHLSTLYSRDERLSRPCPARE